MSQTLSKTFVRITQYFLQRGVHTVKALTATGDGQSETHCYLTLLELSIDTFLIAEVLNSWPLTLKGELKMG